jgi:hypothetical protein
LTVFPTAPNVMSSISLTTYSFLFQYAL